MQDYLITWTQILFISCCFLTVHCAQPNCTSVTDFDDCPGNIRDFCPENIVCACKDGEPFCKCPYFRGRWGNYWYMGTKCDQIWNTLDLILVATLPGIGLALIVGVMIQTVHYCKNKSKKNINDHREERSSSELQPQHNSAYVFDTAVRLSQPDQGQVNTKTHLSDYKKQAEKESPTRKKTYLNNRGLRTPGPYHFKMSVLQVLHHHHHNSLKEITTLCFINPEKIIITSIHLIIGMALWNQLNMKQIMGTSILQPRT
ncbi:uncharacterized protein WM277_010084 isoform 3-T3 [Molossus nigricans]